MDNNTEVSSTSKRKRTHSVQPQEEITNLSDDTKRKKRRMAKCRKASKKRSKLCEYFEELKPSLVKCTNCKNKIHIPDPRQRTKIFRAHLNEHGIYLENDTVTLPDDLKQYYSELPGYKARCNDCGQAVSFLYQYVSLKIHLRRHSKEIQSGDGAVTMAPIGKRSKLWNYFEELNPSLVMCKNCKKEIHIPDQRGLTRIFRAHLSRHKIFPENDTLTLPDDLRQHYSKLSGYKAKCNDCGKAVSFINTPNLRQHVRRHCTRKLIGDVAVTMAPFGKRSKLWNYFEELKPLLVMCTICKKEIQIPHPTGFIKIFRAHLNEHGIFSGSDTRTLPHDLRQHYSELPGYKARCNDCGQTVSFLHKYVYLQIHLRKHSTRIQSRDEAVTMAPVGKRSKLWNYFEELKPSLVMCTICKEEIHISVPTKLIPSKIFRAHLSGHGIFPEYNTRTLPDDLKQHYSKLPGYKAKCNDCGTVMSFLTHISNLRQHLKRHSKRIQSRDKPSTSSLTDYIMDSSAKGQSQEPPGLPVRLFGQTTQEAGALDEPSTSSSTCYVTDPSAEHQCQEPPGWPVQSFEPTTEGTDISIGLLSDSTVRSK